MAVQPPVSTTASGRFWKNKPATMIANSRDGAGIREALPTLAGFSRLYDSAELTDSDDPKVIDVRPRP